MSNLKSTWIMVATAAAIVAAVLIGVVRTRMSEPDPVAAHGERIVMPDEPMPMTERADDSEIIPDYAPPSGAGVDDAAIIDGVPPVRDLPVDDTEPPGIGRHTPANDEDVRDQTPERTAPDRPPGVDENGRPSVVSRTDTTIRRLASEIITGAGPEAATHAGTLLDADEGEVAVIGAAVAADVADWDAALFEKVAGHDDIAVPLFALRALRDRGRDEQADVLHAMLRDRLRDEDDLSDILQQRVLPGTAARALVDLSREMETDEQRMAVVSAVVRDESVDYGARMASLLELRDVMPFEEFRAVVRNEHERAQTDETEIWRTGLERLVERLEGPVQVHTGPTVMTVTDVQLMTAREYPVMYEDLALRVEELTRTEDGAFGQGVSDVLREQIKEARSFPLSDSEAAALHRIEVFVEQIVEEDVNRLAPPGPPGL